MGGILWLYEIQELFEICAPDTDVTKFSWLRELLSRPPIPRPPKKAKQKTGTMARLISSVVAILVDE